MSNFCTLLIRTVQMFINLGTPRIIADGGVIEAEECNYDILHDMRSSIEGASLIITPNAYKEGKLFAIKPYIMGIELAANGDFSSTWSVQGFSLVPNLWGKSGVDDASNYVTQDGEAGRLISSAGNNVFLFKSNILVTGKKYKVTFDILSFSSSTSLKVTNAAVSTTYFTASSNGSYSFYFTAVDTWLVFGKVSGSTAIDYTIDNVSITEDLSGDLTWTRAGDTATRVNESGVIEGVLANVPRINFPPLGGCPSILVKPARTNLLLRSEEFDNAIWVKRGTATVTPNTTTAPDGNATADTLVGATDALWGGNSIDESISGLISSQAYTASVYVKSLGSTTFELRLRDQSTGTYAITSVVPNSEWQRVEVSKTTGGATTALGILLGATNGDVAIWGAQLEAGSFTTSYIPTTTAAVTRNTDVPTLDTTGLGLTEIVETFIDDSVNIINPVPSTYTMSEGSIKHVIGT